MVTTCKDILRPLKWQATDKSGMHHRFEYKPIADPDTSSWECHPVHPTSDRMYIGLVNNPRNAYKWRKSLRRLR